VFLVDARITGKRLVAREMYVITMHAPQIATTVLPGQFVNISWSPGPMLRRPFSVYRVDGERIEIVLKAVGVGTAQLLSMTQGDRVSCLGPLGHGFEFGAGPRSAVLVSGGLGVASMTLAARQAASLGIRVTWVHGARTKEDCAPNPTGMISSGPRRTARRE